METIRDNNDINEQKLKLLENTVSEILDKKEKKIKEEFTDLMRWLKLLYDIWYSYPDTDSK